MQQLSTTVLESQVDYLTLTYRTTSTARALQQFSLDLISLEQSEHHDVTDWRLKGYVGQRCGRVSYGRKGAATLIQLSGQLAEDYAATLIPDATTISRLDLATTVRYDPPLHTHGAQVLEELVAWKRLKPRSANPWAVFDEDAVNTVYLGQRASQVFGRYYNKGKEQVKAGDRAGAERYANCWRYELELHDLSAYAIGSLLVHEHPRSAYVGKYIHDWFSKHGHVPLYKPDDVPTYSTGFRRRSDYERRLNWFRSKVSPSIQTALEQGNVPEVYRALGLKPPSNLPDPEL